MEISIDKFGTTNNLELILLRSGYYQEYLESAFSNIFKKKIKFLSIKTNKEKCINERKFKKYSNNFFKQKNYEQKMKQTFLKLRKRVFASS